VLTQETDEKPSTLKIFCLLLFEQKKSQQNQKSSKKTTTRKKLFAANLTASPALSDSPVLRNTLQVVCVGPITQPGTLYVPSYKSMAAAFFFFSSCGGW
jgi:hypothetical protein